MSLSFPLNVQDGAYPAYMDRLNMKSSGLQAGVVEEDDLKVTAGSGLQVDIAAGRAYIAQTEAKEGEFYNGLYFVANPEEASPVNSVNVSSSYPQLAQIILRVYDVTELGISGSSYSQPEWLNGTPTAGADLTNKDGVAALPKSSFCLAYVLVPASAASSADYTIEDARTYARSGEVLEKESIKGEKLAKETLTGEKLAKETLTGAKLAKETLTGEKLGEGTVRQETGTAQSFLSWGHIGEDGEVLAGSGDFTVEHVSAGEYKIMWATAKSNADYAGIATAFGSLQAGTDTYTTYLYVYIINTSQDPANTLFSFVALSN